MDSGISANNQGSAAPKHAVCWIGSVGSEDNDYALFRWFAPWSSLWKIAAPEKIYPQ